MAVKMSQSLKQSQNLMMTPQLQQAIKLLTLTHLEMTAMISTEMVENPLLEEMDDSIDPPDREEQEHNQDPGADIVEAKTEDFQDPAVNKQKDDFDWDTYAESFETTSSTPPSMATPDEEEQYGYENVVSRGMSLPDHLEWQLRMDNLNEKDWVIADQILHNINDDGYLAVSLEDVISQGNFSRQDVFDLHEKILRLDPVGCGARTLEECLMAQAHVLEERSPLLEKIIKFHLPDLQTKDYKKLAAKLSTTVEIIKDMELIIQSFHPKPGQLVSPGEVQYVVPDIYVVEAGGEFVVTLNDEGVPKLRVSKTYQQMLKKGGDAATKEFVQDKVRAALWLMKSIQNRQRTIHKVAKAIVSKQQEFFKKGPRYLKPLTLKVIAEEIEMHESTVSRVTTNKYMHTHMGVYELKHFFSTAISGIDGGEDVSSDVLKMTIKDMIEKEDPKKPLSDQKIVELLEVKKIEIARRTVAKYRDELGILPSSKRKRA